VDIVVTPSANVRYSNTVSVANASATTDPNLANNTASATLTVGRLPVARCVVPPLRGVPWSRAKAVLKDLRCKVKITHARSRSVHRGLVVKTKPGKGNYVYGKTVKLVVSSGRRP
jgi:beta-lactam-binding protein with PASTA domain